MLGWLGFFLGRRFMRFFAALSLAIAIFPGTLFSQEAAALEKSQEPSASDARVAVDRPEALKDSVRYTLPVVVRPGDQFVAVGFRGELGRTESYQQLDLSGVDFDSP